MAEAAGIPEALFHPEAAPEEKKTMAEAAGIPEALFHPEAAPEEKKTMAELAQQTVSLSELVKITAQKSYMALEEVVNNAPQQSDTEKKTSLLKYIHDTRQRLLRLHTVTEWCKQQYPCLQACQQIEGILSNNDQCFTQAADSLFFAHQGLQNACVPAYDVPSAIEVLSTGSYNRLPKCIEDIGKQTMLAGEEREVALPKLNTVLRSQLLEVSPPKEISSVTVSDGRVVLLVEGEFKVQVTLGYRGHMSLWRILHLELLVGERSGLVKLTEPQRFSIGDDLERRMAAAENPFAILYSVLHEFCNALVIDTVIRQVKTLRQGRWKDAINFELISDINAVQGANIGHPHVPADGEADTSGMMTPGVKIMYWMDHIKGIRGADLGCIPFLKIEPRQDQHITCSHNIFLIDPMTGNGAEFVLNQSCIDVECLLLRAISCNIHTRLLEVQRVLKSNGQLCQAEDDIILKYPGNDSETALNKISYFLQKSTETDLEELGEELLFVRVYGLSYVVLGITIRNGRFLLPSRNLILSSAITKCEEALNQGSLPLTEVFISLRNKSILHHFASIGSFLGLKVYENGLATVKIPKSIRQGSDLLLMSIPNCGKSYFLLMQLDVDFKPLFTMLESHQDSTGYHQISRFRKIDVGRIQIVEEEVNFSLSYNEGSLSSARETRGSDIISESGPTSDLSTDAVIQGQEGLKSAFSSVVDKGMPLPRCLPKQKIFLSSDEPSPSSLLGTGQCMQQVEKFGLSSPRCDGTSQFPAMDENEIRKVIDSPKDGLPIYSDNRQTCVPSLHASPANRSPIQNSRSHPKSSPTGQAETMLKSLASGLRVISPVCQTSDCGASHGNMSIETPKYGMTNRKHCLSDIVHSIPSLQRIAAHGESQKKRKTVCESGNPQRISAEWDVFMEANHGKDTSKIYTSVLLQVVRQCFLRIKHDCLTSQMAALGIQYIEDMSFQNPSAYVWFRLPLCRNNAWENMGLLLVNPGSTDWDVKVNDDHFRDLWELHNGKTGTPWGSGVRIANTSDVDSYIQYGPEGVVLSYRTVEENSIQKLVADLQRLSNARSFAMGMRRLLEVKPDEKIDTGKENCNMKTQDPMKIGAGEGRDSMWRLIRRTFRIEAVGLMGIWFSYFESMPGSIARFVVEWETGKEGCTMHVFPNHLWPHTKFLEDFIDGGEVERLLDCILLTAGPLHALSGAIRPERMVGTASTGIALVPSGFPTATKTNELMVSQGLAQSTEFSSDPQATGEISGGERGSGASGNLNTQNVSIVSRTSRGPGIVPSSLLPTDVSVVLRSPYWIRIFYRKNFAVDMHCSVSNKVWLQPAIQHKGGPAVGGSILCPQFQEVILKYVETHNEGMTLAEHPMTAGIGVPVHLREELNTVIKRGYGGGWVPLASLKNVLRGILNYFGVLWLFSQLVDILGSILKGDGEFLDYLDFERPALDFRVRSHVFAVNLRAVHEQHQPQLLLQVMSVEQFNLQRQGQRQQQQPRNQTNSLDEQLNSNEIGEICDYFSRRVASEPYDASRVASFITLLLLPISILREFLKLIAWKKGIAQGQGADTAPSQRPRVELCLESHIGLNSDALISLDNAGLGLSDNAGVGLSDNAASAVAKSNIHYDRPHNAVDFELIIVPDPACMPRVNAASGEGWLPHCVSVRLKYAFGENPHVSLLSMEGSHRGCVSWPCTEDWERCKHKVAKAVEIAGRGSEVCGSSVDVTQGRLRVVAETLQHSLQSSLFQL